MFSKVLVTGFHVGPVAGTRAQRFVWVLPVRGCDGALDIHPAAQVCDHGVVIVDLRLRPISNDLPCSLEIGLELVSGHVISAGLLSELGIVLPVLSRYCAPVAVADRRSRYQSAGHGSTRRSR